MNKLADWFDKYAVLDNPHPVAFTNEESRLIATALRASPGEAPREGWTLVPAELTEEMKVAGWIALRVEHGDCLLGDAYRAMLAAAPSHSAAEEKG